MDPQGANVGREIFPISSPDFLAFCIIGVFCNMPSCFKMELYIYIYREREREKWFLIQRKGEMKDSN